MKNKHGLLRILAVVALLAIMALFPMTAMAATTADVTITVTPGAIGISDNVTSIDFGTVITSGTAQTDTAWVGITNTSTVETDHTIAVTGNTWTGGATAWTHSDTATAGADTVGLKSNRGGTWGVSDVIVKYATPNYIYENCPATTNYDYGLQILLPTSTTVNDQKTNTVRVTVAAS
jgi:hypothetical protein